MRGLGYPVLIAISLTAAPLFAATAVAAEAGAAAGAPQPHAAAFESDIKAFEVTDRTLRSPTPRIVFIGSSSIRMWDTLAKDFPQHRVVNRGFGGSYIADSTYFADRILPPHKPALIVMYAGANDIDHGNTPQMIAAYCETDPRLKFIDVFPLMLGADGKPRPELFLEDGLHMSRKGYDLWIPPVKTVLDTLDKPAATPKAK